MKLAQFVASQFRRPSGWVGHLMMGGVFNRVNERINELAIERLEVQSEDHVLDLGFGGGLTLPRLATMASRGTVYGLDLSPVMVEQAQRRYRALVAQGRLKVRVGEATRLPYGDGSLTRALTVNTTYFWDNPVTVFRELHRVLADGGRTVIAFRSPAKMDAMRDWIPGYRLYEPDDVVTFLKEAHFRDVRVEWLDRDKRLDAVLVQGVK